MDPGFRDRLASPTVLAVGSNRVPAESSDYRLNSLGLARAWAEHGCYSGHARPKGVPDVIRSSVGGLGVDRMRVDRQFQLRAKVDTRASRARPSCAREAVTSQPITASTVGGIVPVQLRRARLGVHLYGTLRADAAGDKPRAQASRSKTRNQEC